MRTRLERLSPLVPLVGILIGTLATLTGCGPTLNHSGVVEHHVLSPEQAERIYRPMLDSMEAVAPKGDINLTELDEALTACHEAVDTLSPAPEDPVAYCLEIVR